MAQLAAWIPLVYLDKLFALPSQLIFQHVREHIPAIVSYGFYKLNLPPFFRLPIALTLISSMPMAS